jgi:hypothetical protein
VNRWVVALLAIAALFVAGARFSEAAFVGAGANPGSSFATAASFSTVTMTDPGTNLGGTVTLGATTTGAIVSVTVQQSPAGLDAWADVCTDTTSPYSCSFDTTTVSDGLHDFRATADDGQTTIASSVIASRRVDNSAPTGVTMANPGSPIAGSVTFSGSATDAGSGVSSLAFQYSPAGLDTWSDACTDTTAPYTCSFDTTALADGLYDFRSLATDVAGNAGSSTVWANGRVDNYFPSSTMTDPGAYLRGTVTLAATAADDGGILNVVIQRSPAGLDSWTDVCTDTTSPYSCSFDTMTVTDGLYDFRAVATDNAARSTVSTVVASRRVDNAAPAATMTDPGANLRLTVVLGATASDGGSGVASVTIQRSPAGLGTWTDVCTDTTSPYSCSFDTTTVTDGLYDFRAVATDAAGNSTSSAVVAGRRVDNTFPTATMTDPGAYLRATVTLGATASDGGSGVASVTIQRSPAGLGTWTDVCTDTTSPYSCSFDTTAVSDGVYDLRAVATDAAGNSTSSAVVANRTVDNTAPTAVDIQTANGGATVGRPEANDTVTFTYSEQILSTSILAGWNGASQAVTVRINQNGSNDRLEVWNAANNARLPLTNGFVTLNGNFVQSSTTFNATMVQSGASITITLGTQTGGTVRTNGGNATLSWPPSATATDLAGNPCSTTTATESGAADTDF